MPPPRSVRLVMHAKGAENLAWIFRRVIEHLDRSVVLVPLPPDDRLHYIARGFRLSRQQLTATVPAVQDTAHLAHIFVVTRLVPVFLLVLQFHFNELRVAKIKDRSLEPLLHESLDMPGIAAIGPFAPL